jgi:hypothetical protein
MFSLIVFSLLTMVLTQSTMYAIMLNYCVTIMHILYSTMLDYNVSIMHILYSRVISFSHMFCFLLYFFTKLFCIATCSSISDYLKLTMFDLYQCVCSVSTIIMILMFTSLRIFFLPYIIILSTMTSLVCDLTKYYIVSYLLSRKYG